MGTKAVFLRIVIAATVVSILEGLRCWTCNNAKSKRECLENGRFETCQAGQETSCQTEIRHGVVPGNRPLIFKRCKQKMACHSDKIQNKHQCIAGRTDRVCRCCCRRNNCNRVNFWCKPNSIPATGQRPNDRCAFLKKPKHGIKTCEFETNEGEIGSKCVFYCKEGYELKGARVSTCKRTKKGFKFSQPSPRCIQPSKEPTIPTSKPSTTTSKSTTAIPTSEPTTSTLKSTTTTTLKSTTPTTPEPAATTILTPEPTTIKSTTSTTTKSTAASPLTSEPSSTIPTWETTGFPSPIATTTRTTTNSTATKAVLFNCDAAPPAPTSGGYSCIRSRQEVVCTYFCGEDETIVGTGTLTCDLSAGWNGTTPECISECEEFPGNPVNGTRECAGDGGIGTTCTFLCDPGFELIGEESITCAIDDNRVVWNSSSPICETRENIPR